MAAPDAAQRGFPMILARYVARHFVVALVLALAAMTALFLIVDFADRAKFYGGAGWLAAVLELYACKTATTAYQLFPAAMALAGAVTVSAFRRTGEATALKSLGRGPSAYAIPLTVVAFVAGLVLVAAEDPIVVRANYRAEEISVLRFQRWGDWSTYHSNRRWFHGEKGRVYFLGRIDGEGFANVTVFDLDAGFRVKRRMDAARIEPLEGTEWRLIDATVREFSDDHPMTEVRAATRVEKFKEDLQSFRVKTGRPSQLRRRELPAQVELRRKLGLPSVEWELAYYERLVHPFSGAPAAVLGAMVALRPRRRGHLSMAIGEGFAVTLGLWIVNAVARTLVLAGHLSPIVGGVLAAGVAVAAAIAAVRQRA